MAGTNIFETKLSQRMQITRYSTPVFTQIVSFEERANLSDGEAVVRPSFGTLYAGDITRGSDISSQDYVEASETLTVNTIKGLLVPVNKFDKVQHKTDIQARIATDGVRAISKVVDADVLAEVVNATSYVDAGDVGGTAGSAIVLDETNVRRVFSAAQRKLQNLNVDIVGMKDPRPEMGNMKPAGGAGFAVLPPHANELLVLSLAGRETADGDLVGKNAYKQSFMEFDVFVSTNGYWTGTLTIATQPTDGDTVTINGVTLTFKTTLGSTAGNVLIGASAATANANLAALVNTPGTTTAQGVALSTANQNKLRRITATAASAATTFVAKGYGYVVVSETLTAAADIWSSLISHMLFGQKGAIDMVMQSEISVDLGKEPKQPGTVNVMPNCMYGKKTFTEGANALVDVRVDTASWS